MSQGHAMRDWITTLVRDLGPRRPGTQGETLAAERVAEAFRGGCDEVAIEPVASRHGVFFGLVKLMVAGYAGAFLLTFVWPGAALAGAVVLLAAFLLNARGRFVLDPLFAKTRSQNVVGVVRPRGERRRLLLFAGHHDSPILMPLWRPERKAHLPRLYQAALGGFGAQLLFSLAAFLGASPVLVGLLALLAFAGLAVTLLIAWGVLGWRVPCAGANDNLSSVAVVAALAGELATRRPHHTEVRLLSFGCEEEGRFGSRDFAARYAPELKDGVLINMETVGSGELAIMRSERQAGRRHDPAAVELVARAARELGVEVPVVDLAFGATDALSFTEEGLPAVTLFGRDGTGLFSLWHIEEDRPEHLDPACLERALALCRAVVDVVERDASRG